MDRVIYSCSAHIEELLDVFLDENEEMPIMEEMMDDAEVVCHECQEKASPQEIYIRCEKCKLRASPQEIYIRCEKCKLRSSPQEIYIRCEKCKLRSSPQEIYIRCEKCKLRALYKLSGSEVKARWE